jgi:serine/threonine protein phosphatase 1
MRWPFRKKTTQAADAPKVLQLPHFPAAIYVVGDIHGCLDLYEAIEEKIVVDAADLSGPKLIVCLGDVIDRGPETAQLVDRLRGPAPTGFQRLVLQGNHEQMMLEFLKEPGKNARWLAYGGAETLASYGIQLEPGEEMRQETSLLQHKLTNGIPDDHRVFFEQLPCALEVGNYRIAHAGYDLSLPASQQSRNLLIWGPPEHADRYVGPLRLVHGHVPVADVTETDSRIAIDLGSYKTGRIAAVRLMENQKNLYVLTADRFAASSSSHRFQDQTNE